MSCAGEIPVEGLGTLRSGVPAIDGVVNGVGERRAKQRFHDRAEGVGG